MIKRIRWLAAVSTAMIPFFKDLLAESILACLFWDQFSVVDFMANRLVVVWPSGHDPPSQQGWALIS